MACFVFAFMSDSNVFYISCFDMESFYAALAAFKLRPEKSSCLSFLSSRHYGSMPSYANESLLTSWEFSGYFDVFSGH